MSRFRETPGEEGVKDTDERVWHPPVRQIYKVLIAALLLAFTAGGLLAQFLGHAGAVVAYLLFVLIPPLLVIDRAGSPFRRILRLRQIALPLGIVCIVMALPVGLLMSEVDNLIKGVIPIPERWQLMREQAFSWNSPADFAFLALWTILVGPICEEILFRGYALSGFRARYGGGKAILLTAILFGLFHLDPWLFLPTFMMGMLFGFLAVRTGTIYAPMLVHAANNLLSIAGLSVRRFRDIAWLHESLLPPSVLVASLVGLGAAVMWVVRTYSQSTPEETNEQVVGRGVLEGEEEEL